MLLYSYINIISDTIIYYYSFHYYFFTMNNILQIVVTHNATGDEHSCMLFAVAHHVITHYFLYLFIIDAKPAKVGRSFFLYCQHLCII